MPVALVLAGGFLVLFVSGGARFSIGLTLKPMVDELGWLRSDLGLAVALYMVISAFATFVAGRMADRLGARAILGAGTVVGGIGIGLMCLVSAPWQAMLLYGVIFAIGNGAASIIPVGVMVTRAFPHRTGLANAVVSSGMSVGQLVVISALAAVLVAIGWRSVYVWLGIAHLVLVPFLLLAILAPGGSRGVQAAASPAGLGTRQAASTRQFWLLLGVYALSNPHRINFYNHFVWQADAWLDGQASIPYPVLPTANAPGNDYFQDVMPLSGADGAPTGRGLIPFPPLPAVVLLPFVAVLGLATNAQLIATVLAALVVGVAFCYFLVIPGMSRFIQAFAPTSITAAPDIEQYFGFVLTLFLVFGVAFEVPIAVIVLARIGVVNIAQLKKVRGYFVVGAFVVAAVVTPPDVISQLALAVPMILLYEIGIVAAQMFIKHTRAPDSEPADDKPAA